MKNTLFAVLMTGLFAACNNTQPAAETETAAPETEQQTTIETPVDQINTPEEIVVDSSVQVTDSMAAPQ